MNKISVIRWAIILIATIEITLLAIMGTVLTSKLSIEDTDYMESVLLIVSLVTNHLLFIAALVYVYHAFGYFKENGYFNLKSSRGFKTSGILVLLSSLTTFISATIIGLTDQTEGYTAIVALSGNQIPMLFIGFGLLIIADFIKQAAVIEQENQLTI